MNFILIMKPLLNITLNILIKFTKQYTNTLNLQIWSKSFKNPTQNPATTINKLVNN